LLHRLRGKGIWGRLLRSQWFVTNKTNTTAAAFTLPGDRAAGLAGPASSEDIETVAGRLREELRARIAGCFPRRESRENANALIDGLLSELEDHNCWTIAEAAGHPVPSRLQHLLSRGAWDEEQLLDAVLGWVISELGDSDGVLVIDETSDVKASGATAGAARQYCGATGDVRMCQVTVTATYASARGHALIGRALYLPGAQWAADEEHREAAHVPEEVMFATKPELAAGLLARAATAGVPARWVAGDEVYGGATLRALIRGLGPGYVLAVRGTHVITTTGGTAMTATAAATLIKPRYWQRMRTGSGSKGSRDYYWALLQVRADDTPGGDQDSDDGHSWLLLRKHRYTGTISYYRAWSPVAVPLAILIDVAVTRWRIEEDHQLSKQTAGLDSGQVRTWTSWHRWTALSLAAYAYLAITTAQLRSATPGPGDDQLIPVTIPELLRLIRGTVIPVPRRDRTHRDTWSRWRRHHQYQAQQAHHRWHAYADTIPT
jgi:SRSO17 transposase